MGLLTLCEQFTNNTLCYKIVKSLIMYLVKKSNQKSCYLEYFQRCYTGSCCNYKIRLKKACILLSCRLHFSAVVVLRKKAGKFKYFYLWWVWPIGHFDGEGRVFSFFPPIFLTLNLAFSPLLFLINLILQIFQIFAIST